VREEDDFHPTADAAAKNLPDPEDDPARLMHNIYQLQNRPIPEDMQSESQSDAARHETPAAPLTAADENRPRYARTSEPETTGTIQPDDGFMFDQTAADTESPMQFGEDFGSFTNDRLEQKETTMEDPAPFSENAWGSEEHQSPSEPQAEFTTAFDTDYTETDFSLMPDPECAVNVDEAEKLAEPAQSEPEPFSEEAWSQAGASPSEPQAEFGRAAAEPDEAQPTPNDDFNVDETAEYAANFEANFEAAVTAAEDEPREWEPEIEPEMGEVPSVGNVLRDDNHTGDDDISLDELLDEIIKAGE
jgi:hypothetical protein